MYGHFLVVTIVVVAATILVCALVSIHAFDRLVLLQRTDFEAEWRRDGKPYPSYFSGGVDWERSWRAGCASHRCSFAWLFSTPTWVIAQPLAQRYHRRARTSTLLSTAVCIVAAIGVTIGHWFF